MKKLVKEKVIEEFKLGKPAGQIAQELNCNKQFVAKVIHHHLQNPQEPVRKEATYFKPNPLPVKEVEQSVWDMICENKATTDVEAGVGTGWKIESVTDKEQTMDDGSPLPEDPTDEPGLAEVEDV